MIVMQRILTCYNSLCRSCINFIQQKFAKMATFQPKLHSESKLQVGMTDPYINETVTYVAEPDEEAIRRQMLPAYCFLFLGLIFGIFMPIICITVCVLYYCTRKHYQSTIQRTQIYLTKHTLVYVRGDQSIELGRLTIPLANIVSVLVQPPNTIINIKPTAPEVIRSATNSTFATRSVPIPNVKDAEAFAEAIRRELID